MPRFLFHPASVLLALAVFVTGLQSAPAQAQNGTLADNNGLTQHVRPATGGWYKQQSNLGNINFDISDSGVAAGNWSTFKDGKAIWYYFQGQINYPDYAETSTSGVIAIAESPLHAVVTGGGCLTCDYLSPTFAEAGKIRIEFTSTRTARFIHNDTTTIPVVAWMQGVPLVERRDYQGEWLAVVRKIVSDASGTPHHDFQGVVTARLEALEGPETYRVETSWGRKPRDYPFAPGDRRYKFTCVNPAWFCQIIEKDVLDLNQPCAGLCILPPRDFFTLMLKDDEAGEFLPMAVYGDPDGYYAIDDDHRYWKAYGERDRILIRYEGRVEQTVEVNKEYTVEIIMLRLPTGIFRSATPEATP